MCQLLETIKCNNGKLFNLAFHQARFDVARKNFFALSEKICLRDQIEIPANCKKGLFRCRVIYSEKIEKIEFLPHKFREIKSLKLIEDNEIDYRFKYSNRERLDELFEKRGNCDDILIVKNGLITDSFTANPVFFDGKRWWTPDTPLLPGTQRARLIEEKKLSICRITVNNLSKYKKVGLINAMQNFEDMPVIDIKNIFTSPNQ